MIGGEEHGALIALRMKEQQMRLLCDFDCQVIILDEGEEEEKRRRGGEEEKRRRGGDEGEEKKRRHGEGEEEGRKGGGRGSGVEKGAIHNLNSLSPMSSIFHEGWNIANRKGKRWREEEGGGEDGGVAGGRWTNPISSLSCFVSLLLSKFEIKQREDLEKRRRGRRRRRGGGTLWRRPRERARRRATEMRARDTISPPLLS